ncbi:acetolactate synthase small subunit [Gelidibacter algens]|uniref:Acetolactate synthase small subunit n=2 Tax=Gelidibacter algens TaxID=49280 RepID=A0A327SB41_9FLAO|nr:hypothetical protein [Gelidibacter algens]RAJ25144.1 acetolactate synthase small subunit [Gelidibacter algens]
MKNKFFTLEILVENKLWVLSKIIEVFQIKRINLISLYKSNLVLGKKSNLIIELYSNSLCLVNIIECLKRIENVNSIIILPERNIVKIIVALFKIRTSLQMNNSIINDVVLQFQARILESTQDYTIILLADTNDKINLLYEILEPHEILEFSRSSNVLMSTI